MNYKISLFAAAAIAFFTAVSADRTVIVLLNNGVSDSNSGSCNAADLVKTNAVVEKSSLNSTYGYQRYLRTNDVEDKDDMTESMLLEQSGHRDLAVYSPLCKDYCRGQTPGHCTARGCVGYRRRDLLLGEQGDRNLLSGAAFTCTQQVNYINTELNNLVTRNNVTSSCKTLLMKPRNITCFDDVIYGVVEYIKVWDTNRPIQEVLIEKFTGQDLEIGRYINFEVITNDCVDFVNLTYRGPDAVSFGNYDIRPFTLYGMNGARFNGGRFPRVGRYNLTALPDGLQHKAMVLHFNVIPGTVDAVKLWDTIGNNTMNSNFTGGTICNNKMVNFEAVVPYSRRTNLTLARENGPSIETKPGTRPYTIFGYANGTFTGQTLVNDNYTLTIYPDQVYSDKVKVIKFTVVDCP